MRFPWLSTSRRRHYKPLLQVPFVGQQAVLTALATHLQTAQNGTVQCVTLAGQAGSGKSALLEEFIFLHCAKPGVLLLQLNAADCLLNHEVYRQLCTALQSHSEQILQKVYNATQRVRKTLALRWDEAEFRQVLASTDWAQLHEASPSAPRVPGSASTPLAPLLASVQEHPWATAAAAILGVSGRGGPGSTVQRVWEQRWIVFLRALRARHRPGEAVIVLVIDQVPPDASGITPGGTEAACDWQRFPILTAAEQLPLLIVWAGTADSLQPIHQALRGAMPLTEYQIEPLVGEDQQHFIRQAVRSLPRGLQTPWSQALAAAGDVSVMPGRLLLATTCAATTSERPDMQSLASLVQADPAALVSQLVDVIRQRHPAQASLFHQVLEAYAFMPPGKQLVVDDFLPLCDFAGLGLDPVTGRTHLEMLLGQCARYGLLRYDPYAARYTLEHSAIQEALQGLIYPEVSARQHMVRQRRLAAALLHHVQQGERVGLAALAQHVEAVYGAAARDLLAPLVVVPFRRLLPTCTTEERQRMAATLGGFATALAVDLIRCLVHDEDGQVRSSAVQSLADLAREETVPVLLEALQDSNSDVRWIATRALGQMPGTTAVDALIPMLTDEDKEVGRIAAEGLGLQGDRRAVPHLIAAIRESYPLLRESAILALGQLADQRAIPALQDVLHDANQQVRRSAEVALARFVASAGG
jgi:HEAT repeats/AAA ATPase domain/PBS lyase HEAT-like repeat